MDETLGNIKIRNMIWTQTLGIVGSLLFCFLNSQHSGLPTIVDISKIYPNSIVFRIGMLYSLFIVFLNNLFIGWWLQEVNQKLEKPKRLIGTAYLALLSCVSYGLFVSCIDNARINYGLVHVTVTLAAFAFGLLVDAISWNISKLRKADPTFIKNKSWKQKKIFTIINLVLQGVMVGVVSGQLDIKNRVWLEWAMVINTLLYFLTFRIDFKKCEMGVQIDEWGRQPAQAQPQAQPLQMYASNPYVQSY